MTRSERSVLVLGGGFAGVTAAHDLAAEGVDVTLIEARDRFGGRAWVRTFEAIDRTLEYGGTWLLDSHTAILEELEVVL